MAVVCCPEFGMADLWPNESIEEAPGDAGRFEEPRGERLTRVSRRKRAPRPRTDYPRRKSRIAVTTSSPASSNT
jgi:hypothetical protein